MGSYYDIAGDTAVARADRNYFPIAWEVYPEWLDEDHMFVQAIVRYHPKGDFKYHAEMVFSFEKQQLLQMISNGLTSVFALPNVLKAIANMSDRLSHEINLATTGETNEPIVQLRNNAMDVFVRSEKDIRKVAMLRSAIWLSKKYRGYNAYLRDAS